MSKRLAYLVFGAFMLSLNSGCCLQNCINCWHDRYLAHYQATHFHDCGCGERFWSNWANSPPQCCDPCDQWGNWSGRKWWVSNCQGCRGGGCGDCGPGTCPGVSPAGRSYNPGPGAGYDEGMPPAGETVVPTEEVPAPYQSNRGNMRGYQQRPPMQNGPSRMSRQPRYYAPQDPRYSRRGPPPGAEADVMPAQYQTSGPFYDDAEVVPADGYRVSTSSANYRR